MFIYETDKNKKLNIVVDGNAPVETPDVEISKEDGDTVINVNGSPIGGGNSSRIVLAENYDETNGNCAETAFQEYVDMLNDDAVLLDTFDGEFIEPENSTVPISAQGLCIDINIRGVD